MKTGLSLFLVASLFTVGKGVDNYAHKQSFYVYEDFGSHNSKMMKKINQGIEGSEKDSLLAEGAELQLISSQFSFTEGPAVDKKGNVFFTDQPNDKIWKWTTDGKLSVFLDKTGRSNGMMFDRKGNLLSCADEKNEIWSISPKGKVTVLLKDLNGLRLNGPNDLWVDKKGNIYLTDPYYQRAYWDRKAPDIKAQNVYYLPKGKN